MRQNFSPFSRVFLFLTLFALPGIMLAGCSTASNSQHAYEEGDVYDPLEGVNRTVFAFNEAIDTVVMEPVASGYRALVPQPVRTGVRNFLQNLKSPLTIGNKILQGDITGAGQALTRTVVNTFVGFGGVVDVAGHHGIEYEAADFAQTLSKWGVPEGPYVVMPLLGPGAFTDHVGFAVDSYADPLRHYLHNTDRKNISYARTGTAVVDKRESLLDPIRDIRRNSLDVYAATRSAYYQNRRARHHGQDFAYSGVPLIPDYDDYEDFDY